MFTMAYDIQIGDYRLQMLDNVVVKKSVENLADTAIITLPGAVCNRALQIEDKIGEGDKVCIRFGYNPEVEKLPEEFTGYVESIAVDNGSIRITCEDELYRFRANLENKVLPEVSVKQLLQHVINELGDFNFSCDYDFTYDTFTIYNMTGLDVLKKVQEETAANIYLQGNTLHIHPQYSQIDKKVIYDFEINVEKSDLVYKDANKRKLMVVVEGTDKQGKSIQVMRGVEGGDKISFKRESISDIQSLENFAEEILKAKWYSGYEGSITGWLIPYIIPTYAAEIRDADYPYKNGIYYVVSVETTFSQRGGVRKITLGKKIQDG